jgi:hypothetical protein
MSCRWNPLQQRPGIHFDEWATSKTVAPVAKIPVTPLEFPFLDQVVGHPEAEPMYLSWLLYKARQKRRS